MNNDLSNCQNKKSNLEKLEKTIKYFLLHNDVQSSKLLCDLEFLSLDSDDLRKKPLIYQYVSKSAFQNIIENNELWATNLAYMNDSEELKDGCKIFSEIIYEKYNSFPSKQNFFMGEFYMKELSNKYYDFDINSKDFEQSFWKKFYNYFNSINMAIDLEEDIAHVYATCFTRNGDQLSQWRGYGQEGFSIGFEPYQLKEIISVEKKVGESVNNSSSLLDEIRLSKVEYNEGKKKKYAQFIINLFEEKFQKIKQKSEILSIIENLKETSDSQSKLKEEIINSISNAFIEHFRLKIDEIISICKNNGFIEEDEVRLIYFADQFIHNCLNFRNGYIPYIKFKPKQKNQKLPIKEIIISPDYSNKINQVKSGIKLLLTSQGYSTEEIKIRESEIPFRG
jgi:hypothetical protein